MLQIPVLGGECRSNCLAAWEAIPSTGTPLKIVFGVDGSMQPIRSETQPYKELAFVKTAILKVDSAALAKVDRENPHPFALRDIMADSASHHATVFPLKNVGVSGISAYHAIRQIIFDSLFRPDPKTPYGRDTNYGDKVFVKLDSYHQMVLNIPTEKNVENPYLESPKLEDLIGAVNIFATLPELLSYRHEGGLLPVELANGVASLSTYPSARILKMFAEENFKTPT